MFLIQVYNTHSHVKSEKGDKMTSIFSFIGMLSWIISIIDVIANIMIIIVGIYAIKFFKEKLK